jgi:hypothetical protein
MENTAEKRLAQLERLAEKGVETDEAIDLIRHASELSEEETIADLAAALGVEADEITDLEMDQDGGTFKSGFEYRFFWDEDTAERVTVEQVKNDLESDPEMFTQSWLQSFVTITDTDRRIIAGEEADDYVDNVADEATLIEEAGKADEYAEAQTAGDEARMATIAEEAKEEVRGTKSEELEKELADPIQYFVHDRGMYSIEDLMKANFIMIDTDEAAQDAVSTDGWPHFVSHYDGNYETTGKGLVYFREN